ncbi:MAG TPA: alpha-2-macroglobulin family protein [Kofleriaceae bacterium]
MKRTLAAALLVFGVQAYAGGLGTIEGTVVNASGATLSKGVRVTITCGAVKKAATLDGAGHFSVAGLPEGTCTITANGSGFQTINLQVTVTANSIATVLVGMAPPRPTTTVESRAEPGEAMPAPVAAEPMPPMDAPRNQRMPARPAPKLAGPMGGAAKKPPPMPPMQRVPVKLDANDEKRPMGRLDRGKRLADKLEQGEELRQDVMTYAPVRVFPVPQYTKSYDGPRTDFRETIYWNPSVETKADGTATVTFVASDAVTAFKATAEGFSATGVPGAGSVSLQSKLPLTLDAKLPVEVTAGDKIRLPITITNETGEAIDANLATKFGSAFKLTTPLAAKIRVKAHDRYSVFAELTVGATNPNTSSDIVLALDARGLKDEVKKTIRVVPRGFPFETSVSGTAKSGVVSRHEIDLAGALPGSLHATVTMYPSPLAAMTKGMEGMIREPGGCFEQTSSTNYPNIMILGYMQSNDAAEPALVQKTQGVLDKGYKLLTGYETKQRGYEWFGQTPGHEALTAYGLMEFADMAKVYDVDPKMVARTADWLMSRRDGKGGFQRSKTALDSFGRASEATTNAYIMWALAEAKRYSALGPELAVQKTLGSSTKDPYLLALATNTALLAAPRAPETTAMVKRLATMQSKDGSFSGAKESITMSGGESLAIETTSLAVLAMIKAKADEGQIRTAVDYLNAKRGGYGQWGNTQATVLGLKALTAYSEHARQMAASGSATLLINGKPAGTIAFEKGRREALVWDGADVATKLAPGKNVIEVKLDGASLPYSIALEYRSAQPQSAKDAKVAISTQLLKSAAKMGEGVTLRANIENKTQGGIPMTLARVGIPGGMVFQTWQLKELRDKGLIDFYETRPREVILYWRALPPGAKKAVDLNLLATVPGTYEAPASSAYLYYTAEAKAWTAPVSVAIER